MSNYYTTGEIAKLCGVTVRTVQYYDTRNILAPSQLSEGGRRLYSEDDLKRMQNLLDNLEDNDDVTEVWHNWDDEE